MEKREEENIFWPKHLLKIYSFKLQEAELLWIDKVDYIFHQQKHTFLSYVQ